MNHIELTHFIKRNLCQQFDRAVRLFGEDNSSIQPDEFFGIFDSFLLTFIEAKSDNENMKKRKEEEEKRAKQDAEVCFVKLIC